MPLWNYLLRRLSPRQYMVNKIIKTDLSYFKDANIDTFVPLQYSYFSYQRTIAQYFSRKKHKFHTSDILQTMFIDWFAAQQQTSSYSVAIHAT